MRGWQSPRTSAHGGAAATGQPGAKVQWQRWPEHYGDAGSRSGKVMVAGAQRDGMALMGQQVHVAMAALKEVVELRWMARASKSP
jgi:hypothetical protein